MMSMITGERPRLKAFKEVPQIDIGPMFTKDSARREQVGNAVRDACSAVGFFYLRNHGVPQSTIDAAFRQMARFFAQPDAAKREIHASKSRFFRGYSGIDEERHDATTDYYEPHEVIDYGRENEPGDPAECLNSLLYGPNLWPSRLPGFLEAVKDYYAAMVEVSIALLRAFALALDLPEDYFLDMFDRAAGALRLLHYPPQPSDETRLGVGAHTDYETFTILAQDANPGLQVLNSAGEWIDVPPIGGAFVVNIGDLMARWTNDRFTSSIHRAANRTGQDRYSIPFFMGANVDTEVRCLETCIRPDHPAKYPPVLAGKHIEARLVELQDTLIEAKLKL
jgi:isopenicillin N synthase-like dioxygenase